MGRFFRRAIIFSAEGSRFLPYGILKRIGSYTWFMYSTIVGSAAYQLGNTSYRTITEVKQR